MAGDPNDPVTALLKGSGTPSPGGGGSDPVAALLGGGAPPASGSNSNPTAGKPSNGGGGIFHFIVNQAKELNPVSALKGLGLYGMDLGKGAIRGGENIANDIAFAATRPTAALGLGGTGGANEQHLGALRGTPDYNSHTGQVGLGVGSIINTHPGDYRQLVKTDYPAVNAQWQGLKQAGEQVIHPSQLGHGLATDPVGTLVNLAGAAALVAGPAAGAAGAAAEGTDSALLANAAEHIAQAGHVAGKVATGGLAPITGLDVGETHIPGLADTPVGQKAVAHIMAARDAIQSAQDHLNAAKEIHGTLAEKGATSAEAERGVAQQFNGVTDPTAFSASVLKAQGLAPVLAKIVDEPAAQGVLAGLLPRLGTTEETAPSVEAAKLAAHGEAPNAPAIQTVAEARGARELQGYGRAPGKGPLNPAQNVPEPIIGPHGGLTAEDLMAAPAKYRPSLAFSRDAIAALKEEAGKNPDPATAADLQRIAAEIEPFAHLAHFQEPGVEQPTHVIGTHQADTNALEAGRTSISSGPQTGKFKAQRATHQRTGNATNYTIAGQRQLEVENIRNAKHNEVIKTIDASHSVTPATVLGEHAAGMSGGQIAAAMKDAGYKSWEPSSFLGGSNQVPIGKVTADTRFLPGALHDELNRQFRTVDHPQNKATLAMKAVGRGVDKATNTIYRGPLSLSPSYLARRAVGNAFMAHVNGDVPIRDFPRLAAQAVKAIHDGTAPAAFDEHLNDEVTRSKGPTAILQRPARVVDKMGRVMVYLSHAEKGEDFEKAVRAGNEAMGDLSGLSPAERNIVSRVFPIYSWAKAVAAAGAKIGEHNPALALLALHIGHMAEQNPAGFPTGRSVSQLNPFDLFNTASGSLVNPVIRGAVGAGTGLNLSTMKPVTRPPDEKQTGPLGVNDLPYYLANQFPIGKLYEQSPLSGKDQEIARYNTGQPEVKASTGRPLTAYVPPTKTSLGEFGPYFSQFLGQPKAPAPNPSGEAAHQKALNSKAKAAAKYAREIATLKAQGIK